MASSNSSSSGIGFLGLLTIVFITLKLVGKLAWPWFWVVAPLWIPLAVFLAVVVFVFILHRVI
jgi:hypothetical protein